MELRPKVDEYAFQVVAPRDDRFWLRLERCDDRDVITDYFLGSAPPEDAGRLLVECYQVLGLVPGRVVVFRDIMASWPRAPDPATLDALVEFYAAAGAALLCGRAGSGRVSRRVETDRNKHHLILEAVP